MENSTKILIGVLVCTVIVFCTVMALFMYQKMKMNAIKKPATNYVVDESKVPGNQPSVTPTGVQPTVPPQLSQPVAKDASEIGTEIEILDVTTNTSTTPGVNATDIQNLSQ